jgi:hypothetical protein
MKLAISLRLSGELVNAADCNYNSFKDLVLICPHCKQSVFLIGEHTRSATVRKLRSGSTIPVVESSVSPYFSHHSIDSELCEVKNKSISTQLFLHYKTVARNQRFAIFRKRFWELFCTNTSLAPLVQKVSQRNFDFYVDIAIKKEKLGFSFDPNPNCGASAHNLQRGNFSIDMSFGMNIAKDVYSINLLRREFAELLPKLIKAILDKHCLSINLAAVHSSSTLESLSFLYAPANSKMLKKCLASIMTMIYVEILGKAVNYFASNSVISLSPDLFSETTKNLISNRVADETKKLLERNESFILDSSLDPIVVSTLFVTLVVSLHTIDWTR